MHRYLSILGVCLMNLTVPLTVARGAVPVDLRVHVHNILTHRHTHPSINVYKADNIHGLFTFLSINKT